MAGHFSSLLAAETAEAGDCPRIPVTVLTGFLGSGKTTLLNRLLKLPDLKGTAVIVNEFGEVGIDHDLIAQTTDDTVLLANGCLCCAVRGDLVEALTRLAQREPPPQRVLLETSGLADPGPILRTLMGDAAIRARYALAGVACTVDAVLGSGTLEHYPEAVEQVAVADALFLTKTDLLDGPPAPGLLDRIAGLNPQAALHEVPGEHCDALLALMQAGPSGPLSIDTAPHYRPMSAPGDDGREPQANHRAGIRSFTLTRDEPLARDAFFAWLDMMIAMRGADLLRVKGLVCLADEPDRPLVIHGVQHLFHPPEFLPAWPGPDRRTRIVFITRGVDRESMDETLRVFERRRKRGA